MLFCSCPAPYLIYTSHFQDRVLKYTAIWNKTMFTKAENHLSEGCFQSATLCGKYPYIGDLYLQIVLILLLILWNTEASIFVKILLDAAFSGIQLTESFLRERIHSENLYENHLLHFFWSLWCSFARNTADFKISIFYLVHKVPLSTSFGIRKSLKRMPSLVNTEIDQTKIPRFIEFAFGCIIWRMLHVLSCT